MKKALALLIICSCTTLLEAKRPRQPKPQRAQNARVVLSNLAKMIGEIGHIIENPHDPEVIGDAVSGIADNIIRITVNAVQNRMISLDEADSVVEHLYTLCKRTRKKHHGFSVQSKKMQRLL